MKRRTFLRSAAAGVAASAFARQAHAIASDKPRRVGLIGCGWYGKCDLLRLLQVSPVEVVSLCDVNRDMLAGAAEVVAAAASGSSFARWMAAGSLRSMLSTGFPFG
jgi:ornithine cyclodeaminase/alanine dehydrogenase-like protein (mu-crystallin family)